MYDIETELRETMRSHAEALQGPPPLRNDAHAKRGSKGRGVLVGVLAAALTFGAGVAVAGVGGGQGAAAPVSDRLPLVTGNGQTGSFSLTAYKAEVTNADGGSSAAWCLDLESPVDGEAGSAPSNATVCRSVQDPSTTPIAEHALFPRLVEDQGLLYGWVSPEVDRLQMTTADGGTRDLDLTAPPEDLGIGGAYFGAIVPAGTVQLVAFSSSGAKLQTLTLPGSDAS